MTNCAVCREDMRPGGGTCPRCGSENQQEPELTFGYFASIWGILSFALILGPLLMLLPPVLSRLHNYFLPVASVRVAAPISLLLTAVPAFYLFTLRDDLHAYSLSLSFREKRGTPVPLIALWCFGVAVVLMFVLGFAVTSKDMLIGWESGQIQPGSTGHLLFSFLMTGCLILVFTFFAMASGLMAVYEFGLYADQRVPLPIYLNERLMLDVVLGSVQDRLGDDVELSITKMRRMPDAGMSLLLHQKGSLTTVDGKTLLEEKGWLVEADLWARLRNLVEHGPRMIQVQEPQT